LEKKLGRGGRGTERSIREVIMFGKVNEASMGNDFPKNCRDPMIRGRSGNKKKRA